MDKSTNEKDVFQKAVCGYSLRKFMLCHKLSQENSLEQRVQLALLHLSLNCRAGHGYVTYVSSKENLENAELSFLNHFDSGLIVSILYSAGYSLPRQQAENLRVLLESSLDQTGTCNYFQGDYCLIPKDVDSNALVLEGLWELGHNKLGVRELGKNLLENLIIHEDTGFADVYLPISNNQSNQYSEILDYWKEVARVDVVVIANIIHLLLKISVSHVPKLQHCYHLINRFLEAFEASEDFTTSKFFKFAKNYKNLDVVLFFIARLVPLSSFARKMFKGKLQNILKARLFLPESNPIAIACRIYAAVLSGLCAKEATKAKIVAETKLLLSFQNESGSFPAAALYNAHGKYFFGSSDITTCFVLGTIALVKNNFSQEELNVE